MRDETIVKGIVAGLLLFGCVSAATRPNSAAEVDPDVDLDTVQVALEIVPESDILKTSTIVVTAGPNVGQLNPRGPWKGTVPQELVGRTLQSFECELKSDGSTKSVKVVRLQTRRTCVVVRESPIYGLEWRMHTPNCIAPESSQPVGVAQLPNSAPPAIFADIREIVSDAGECKKLTIKVEL